MQTIEIEKLKAEYETICQQLEAMDKKEAGSYSAQVAKSFHLGRVGGSGRNTHRLNKRREQEIDRTVKNAVVYCELVRKRDSLKRTIDYHESGQNIKDEERKNRKDIALIEWWKSLKPGDKMQMGNGEIEVKRKSKKSFTCTSGINWTAAEIIGKKLSDQL